jgi:hypothetical protein
LVIDIAGREQKKKKNLSPALGSLEDPRLSGTARSQDALDRCGMDFRSSHP